MYKHCQASAAWWLPTASLIWFQRRHHLTHFLRKPWSLTVFCTIIKQKEIIALDRQGTQQQRPASPTVTTSGMRVNTRYINSTKGTSSKKDTQIVCEKHLQRQQDLCLWCFVHLITFIITQRPQFKDSRQTQQGILKQNAWFRVLSLISFRLLDDTVLRGYCFERTNTFMGQGLYKYPSFQTQASITGLQASNHQYEISKKRQSIFLSRGEANVDQPATTWLKKNKKNLFAHTVV